MPRSVPSSKEKTIFLKSKDGQAFPIKMNAAKSSIFLARMIQDLALDEETGVVEIPLRNEESAELEKVIEFLEGHVNDISPVENYVTALKKNKLSKFDRAYIKIDMKLHVSVYTASHSLDIPRLRELMAYAIAKLIKGKKAAEIKEQFHYSNDLTDWELQKIKKAKEGVHDKTE